jgi:hypothetical protein
VALLAPADAYPLLAPALRRPISAGIPVTLCATGPVDLGFAAVEVVPDGTLGWPGMPIIAVIDDRIAVVAGRQGSEVRGHWSTAPSFVAAARRHAGSVPRVMTAPDDGSFELQREYLAELPGAGRAPRRRGGVSGR